MVLVGWATISPTVCSIPIARLTTLTICMSSMRRASFPRPLETLRSRSSQTRSESAITCSPSASASYVHGQSLKPGRRVAGTKKGPSEVACLDEEVYKESRRSTWLVAPQGFEPRLIGSEPTVLPLNEGAIKQRTAPLCGSADWVPADCLNECNWWGIQGQTWRHRGGRLGE